MKKLLPLASLLCVFLLGGCLTSSVSNSGGMGANTVSNSNVGAIMDAARTVFADSGYTLSGSNFPTSLSFDRPAGTFGKLMYGSYGVTTTVRVTLNIIQIPGTNDYRLSTKVSRVSDAGEAGFEDDQKMLGMWSGQFKPLLARIAGQAGGVGPGY